MTFTEIKNEKLKEKYYYTKHKTGLDIFVFPKKGFSKTYAIFSTKYGSIDNKFKAIGDNDFTEVPEGIAHFLEHKLFENENENAFVRYAKTGANANAYTSFDKTAYLFSCTDNFSESFKILLDFVQSPYFTEETVRKEQGIIGQEIRMYDDSPDWQVFFNMLKGIYTSHPIRMDIAGTVESIAKITPEYLYKCYNTFYNPENMVVCVCGDVDEKEVLKIADETLKPMRTCKVERNYPKESNSINQKKVTKKLPVSVPLFNIGIKEHDLTTGKDGLKRKAATELLLQLIAGESSPLYKRMYDEGLINSNFGTEYMNGETFGVTFLAGESKDPQKVYDLIFEEIDNIKKNGIEPKDFERCRKYLYGRLIRRFNSVESIANDFISAYFEGVSILDAAEIYEKTDIEYTTDRLNRHFKEEFAVLSIVEPV